MKQMLKMTCLLFALILLLSSCSPALKTSETTAEETTVEAKDEKTTEEKKETEEEAEEAPPIMQQSDPRKDNEINLLMIGNSFCNYYTQELYGMAKAAGVNMRVYNLYYSGCTLAQHWEFWRRDTTPYKLYLTDENGRQERKNISLRVALRQENWDMISLQQGFFVLFEGYESGLEKTRPYAKDLFGFLREQFPQTQLYWHQTWAYQVGYDRSNGKVPDKATQNEYHDRMKKMSRIVAEENNVTLVPSGDAWFLARQNPLIGDTLCAKSDKNNGLGDYYHDGDIGGGQYLNACVWFEMLTGESCIGNSYRPKYTFQGKDASLTEEKINILQNTAHQAVADVYGNDFAK